MIYSYSREIAFITVDIIFEQVMLYVKYEWLILKYDKYQNVREMHLALNALGTSITIAL